jgi:hypothetical protein
MAMRSTIKMWIICGSVMFADSPFWMVIPYWREIVFTVTEHKNTNLCSNGSFRKKWGVDNYGSPWHLRIRRIILRIGF